MARAADLNVIKRKSDPIIHREGVADRRTEVKPATGWSFCARTSGVTFERLSLGRLPVVCGLRT